jgi:hypothetical protein
MEFLSELWLPIVVSAVIVFFASFVIHMVVPLHKGEWKGAPDEGKLLGGLEGMPPGQYMFPWAEGMAAMKSPEFEAKLQKGPVGQLIIHPKPWNMGRNLFLMIVFNLVVGVFIAYVAWHGMGSGAHDYLHVFRVTGAAALMAYGLGWIPNAIWYGGIRFWTYAFDSLVYALLTAGTFGWLWPRVAPAVSA